MTNLTSVGVTNGVPTTGTGTVSTIDALMADGGQVTIGAKADATWDGSSAASLVALNRYVGAKLEAVRALLSGTLTVSGISFSGGDANAANQTSQITQATATNTVLGTKTDAKNAATDATSVSLMSVFKQISASAQAIVTAVTGVATAANQASQITQETAINTVLGTKADAKNTATDTTAISAMSVFKQISASIQAAATALGAAAFDRGAGAVSSNTLRIALPSDQIGTAGQRPVAEATTVIPPSDQAFPVTDGGSGLIVSWGVAGVPVASADMTTAANVTDVPTTGQKIVIDDILFSVGPTAMNITLKEETSGTVLFGPWYCPANSGPVQITLRGKKKLATANKRVQCQTSAAGTVTVQLSYHSEA